MSEISFDIEDYDLLEAFQEVEGSSVLSTAGHRAHKELTDWGRGTLQQGTLGFGARGTVQKGQDPGRIGGDFCQSDLVPRYQTT